MAKTTRTKEIWHIPKRGNVHQTIYMVHVLTWDKFLEKSWSSGKQEMLASEMGKAGLTDTGGAISHQSVRTLLANLPKYLGFVYIDNSSTPSRIFVTDVGYQLIKFHKIENVSKHRNLKAYYQSGDLIEISEIFNQQMSKLIITNPSILNDCQNVLVFPFRMTLKLLLELDYLDKEEIGYILFHTKSEDEYDLLIEKIKNFRALAPDKRQSEIDAYKKTEEGQLTLVKAPTAGYYMYLCYSTGLCDRVMAKVNKVREVKLPAIKLKDKASTIKLLDNFKDAEIYDFKNNGFLWKEYFSNPKRLYPPFDASIKTTSEQELLVTVIKDDYMAASEVISNKSNTFTLPVFGNEEYKIIAYLLENGKEIFNEKITFSKGKREFVLDVKISEEREVHSVEKLINQIHQMFQGKWQGFDQEYYRRLEVIKRVLGKDYVDNRRKGGRLEYLFFELLNLLKNKGIIDEVYWYGKQGPYGVCEPAPGGKEGFPDIVFEIAEYSFVLELTTIRGIRGQWDSAEASSVPDHIIKFKATNSHKKVIGIFSAPSIHEQLAQNLLLNARQNHVGMLFEPSLEFAKILQKADKKSLLKYLLDNVESQLKT